MSTGLSRRLRQLHELDPQIVAFWCPACDKAHAVHVGSGARPSWEWNGDAEYPTFRPSLVVRVGEAVCHCQVVDGQVWFMSDCTHRMKGKTVYIPDWPGDVSEWALEQEAVRG